MSRTNRWISSGIWLEIFSAKAMLSWCILDRYLGDDVFNHEIYEVAFHVMPRWAWEAVGIVLSSAKIASCVSNNRPCRTIIAVLTCSYWSLLAFSIRHMDTNVLGVVFYVEFAMMDFVAVVLLLRPRRTDE